MIKVRWRGSLIPDLRFRDSHLATVVSAINFESKSAISLISFCLDEDMARSIVLEFQINIGYPNSGIQAWAKATLFVIADSVGVRVAL